MGRRSDGAAWFFPVDENLVQRMSYTIESCLGWRTLEREVAILTTGGHH